MMSKYTGRFKPDHVPVDVKGYRYHIPKPAELSGWKFGAFVAGIVGFIGLMMWPIVIDPILHIDKYKRIHEEVQADLFQSGLLPGQLRKWEDPWKKRSTDQ
ncbi:uncharacterized protein LOC135832311 [Planococcus citri]|uniref:uncharacterized protein LOC135832311 n=1 Tax=Planococcus citri TaxID=170843 RepID=UPI0031F88FF8